MAVSILVSGQHKVVADVIPVGLITLISNVASIYSGSEWLDCDGSAVSRSEFADLFSVIGTTFGPGDGSSTFNIPNANAIIMCRTGDLTDDTEFLPFFCETIITVNNSASKYIDIHNGATQAGIRLTIIHKTTSELKIYTGEGQTRECVLPQGMIVLEWDGTQWCLIGESVRMRVSKTANTTWQTPFAGVYTLSPVGGGGGGGGAYAGGNTGYGYGGNGAGGACQQVARYYPAGTGLTIVIGSGGSGGSGTNAGAVGSDTTINDGTYTYYGMGGGGGGAACAFAGGGSSGSLRYPTSLFEMARYLNGRYNNAALDAGSGGTLVTPSVNGNPGGNYGGGGSGGATVYNGTNKTGGAGAPGIVFIEY